MKLVSLWSAARDLSAKAYAKKLWGGKGNDIVIIDFLLLTPFFYLSL